MQETWVQSLGLEDLLEKEMATHSSILAWKIPWMEGLVGYSPWGRKESDMTERTHSEEEKKKGYDKKFKEIIVENFPNKEKEIVNQVQEAQRIP